MLKLIVRYCFILGASVFYLFSCTNEVNWVAFVSEKDNFSVNFPRQPRDTAIIAGLSLQNEYFVRFYGDEMNSYYKVNCFDLPKLGDVYLGLNIDPCESVSKFDSLDMANYALQINGHLRREIRKVKLDGKEVSEFKVDFSDKSGVVSVRKICSGGKLYTLMVITRAGQEDNALSEKFFGSFRTNVTKHR